MTRRSSLLLGVALALPAAVVIALVQQRRAVPALPEYWTIPAFTLVDQDSALFRDADLAGYAWLVSFAYTNCPDVCPLVTQRMAQLRDQLARRGDLGSIRLLTISVDPQRDSPAVLRAHAQQWRARKPDWFFLTGQPDSVFSLVNRGFKLSLLHPAQHGNQTHQHDVGGGVNYLVAHSDRIVLVDRQRKVRGTYAWSDPGAQQDLERDIRRVR